MAAPTDRSTWTNVASNWNQTQGYPVPENLRYSTIALQSAGSDGKALGDLNWFPEQLTAVSQSPASVPSKFELSQNYPNPFNPTTMISYSLSKKGMTRLSVFDVLGREVAVLVDEVQNPGSYNVTFLANNLSSGIYFYKLTSSGTTLSMKMILMK
ncbi:MAG: T9SS type A sorting domain-containing protein [Bacteroidota bacterium]